MVFSPEGEVQQRKRNLLRGLLKVPPKALSGVLPGALCAGIFATFV